MKKYDTYKDSGIEWVGEIPEHWITEKMKYFARVKTGYTPSKANENNFDENEGWPWIKPDDLQEYTPIYNSKEKITENGLKTENIIPSGSVLLCGIGSIGKFGVAGCDLLTNQQINSIIFNNKIHSSFGKFLIGSASQEFDRNANGNVVRILNSENQANISFPIPPLKEQTAIASYLDQKTSEIDELIADKEELLKLYEEEKTALINQAVTKGIDPNVKMKDSGIDWLGEIPEHWEVKRFKYFFNLINIKTDEKLKKIGLENIESKSGNYIETDSDFAGQGIRFYPNDILFGKLRPYLAKVWLAEFEGHAVGDFYVFRPKNTIFPDFGKYRMLDFSFIEVTNSSTYGSKMPRVSWEFIADLEIAFPSFEEQQSIVNYIESETTRLDDKINNTEKLIELLKEYREALISEVVTGKVKVI